VSPVPGVERPGEGPRRVVADQRARLDAQPAEGLRLELRMLVHGTPERPREGDDDADLHAAILWIAARKYSLSVDVNGWLDRSRQAIQERRWDDAIEACDHVIALEPGNKKAWNNRGVALAGEARYEEAVDAYSRALELSPNDPRVVRNLGECLPMLGRDEERLTLAEQAIEAHPSSGEAWEAFGDACGAPICRARRKLS
jgi:tetratricopeptide (TPR) repeat protein